MPRLLPASIGPIFLREYGKAPRAGFKPACLNSVELFVFLSGKKTTS